MNPIVKSFDDKMELYFPRPHTGCRQNVPIHTLRIATNFHLCKSKGGSNLFSSDYVFTGSYHNTSRDIMGFNPSDIPQWRGIIIGQGWSGANVSNSWKSISRGSVAYSKLPSVFALLAFHYLNLLRLCCGFFVSDLYQYSVDNR